MSAEYNSQMLRDLAKQAAKAGEVALDAANKPLKGVLQEVPENFRGKAADALYESVSELREDVVRLGKSIFEIQSALYRFADQLEAADQQSKDIIISK